LTTRNRLQRNDRTTLIKTAKNWFIHKTIKRINMVDIIHRIGIRASLEKVYNALSTIQGLAHWWTENVEGDEQTGGEISFTFREKNGEIKGKMMMEVLMLAPPKEVRWCCKKGPDEWIGTEITFQLSQAENQTIIIFGHRNWSEAVEFTAHCSMKWAIFLLSLRDYVETGKGSPSPHDVKIDNWN
jgi:uncharacterized protein YndB with AHSA1/START domain